MESSISFRLLFTCIALQPILFWSCGNSQKPGFLSINCGSEAASVYTDDRGIEWLPDTNYTHEGTPTPLSGASNQVLNTMRLFDGNQSKYCYSLTNSVVQAGAFFLVRVGIWPGKTPPYMPKNSDGYFRFKLIVDADDVDLLEIKFSYGSTDWWSDEVYMRAQRSSIDVCLARITPDGDAAFISSLELRPLPSTLTSTVHMNLTNGILIYVDRADYGVPSSGPSLTRFPYDSLDRLWISFKASDSELNTTDLAIDVANQIDQLPARILQNTYTAGSYFTSSYSNLDSHSKYFVEFYFAEINPAVDTFGQRAFNVLTNGEVINTDGAIDVLAEVGENTAYAYSAVVAPNATGGLTFNFTPTATSIFPPFIAAVELFQIKQHTAVTTATIVSAVEEIKMSLGLNRYTGDPCLPIGYGYSWLNCSKDSAITALLLSNYNTGGGIPAAIYSLTALTEVHLEGNALQGEIPDLSALANLETLDLSNNKLSGPIPSFLTTLKNLKVLYLQNNNLSGEIPAALLQRKKASQLTFEFSGNAHLCETSNGKCSPSPSSPPVVPNSNPSQPKKKSRTGIVIGVAVAGFVCMSIVIGIGVYCFCMKGAHKTKVIEFIPKLSVRKFSFQEIRDATNKFSTKLGQGGFGPVYEGCLQDGSLVAIKVSSKQSHQGSKEFLNEVDLLSRVHHKNLVSLLGYCNREKLVLVYEFMSNGSLFDCLHGPHSRASALPWATRLHILVDAAQGLDYLHNGCSPPIIHRDIKSGNILLNDLMEAKISDFGISRDYMKNETGALTTTLMGSMGYMDPEYLSGMKLTEKVDVYSFGVLLLEVVCGRKAVFHDSSLQQPINLVEWVKASVNRGVIDYIVDLSLHGHYDVQSVWKVVEVALACVQIPSFKRPKMSDVYLELREAE